MKEGAVPVKWSAPEVLQYGKFSSKSDVYSFGGTEYVIINSPKLVCLWEIFNDGVRPWKLKTNEEVSKIVISGSEYLPREKCPEDVYKLAQKCWKLQPNERPSFQTVLDELKLRDEPEIYHQSPIPVKKEQEIDYQGMPLEDASSKGNYNTMQNV